MREASTSRTVTDTDSYAFSYNKRQREDDRGKKSGMTIAKGRTICQAERNLVRQGFSEQLQILEDSQVEQENVFKAKLYDIITDLSISDDEKPSLKHSWSSELQELEERHIRIRRSVFIGLYSFWEVSLMDIANTYLSTIIQSKKTLVNKSISPGASDYLKQIYGKSLPASIVIIDENVREFRNYLVHGSLTEKRMQMIDELLKTHPEFCIGKVSKHYFLRSYKGLMVLLNELSRELDSAEDKLLEIKRTR